MLKTIKKSLSLLSLALSNVEKTALSNTQNELTDNVSLEKRYKEGNLSDSLINGVVNEEVEILRARMYKILKESNNYGYLDGERGFKKNKPRLTKIKGEPSDELPVICLLKNITTVNALVDEEASNPNYSKNKSLIEINRDIIPSFKLEDYTNKLIVKEIDKENHLLEFFISKYPDNYNRKTIILVNKLKQAINNIRASDILDINEVSFITSNTLGLPDFLHFKYNVDEVFKVVEYEGDFVLKFKCSILINGEDITKEFENEELNKRYDNKTKKR